MLRFHMQLRRFEVKPRVLPHRCRRISGAAFGINRRIPKRRTSTPITTYGLDTIQAGTIPIIISIIRGNMDVFLVKLVRVMSSGYTAETGSGLGLTASSSK
jgi:hypothetical protein